MYIVVRRGAFETIDEGGRLAGLAAVRALEAFGADPEWIQRPGKVVLRARSPSQWARVLEEPHAAASDGVVALPPRRRSERGDALTKIQAMSTELEPPPADVRARLVYALNPSIEMSSGKTLAQIAHAAVMAAELGYDVSRARVIAPATFALPGCVAEVRDAGLTEVPPGTTTVRVLVREGQAEPDDDQRDEEDRALEPMSGAVAQVPEDQRAGEDDQGELGVQGPVVP
jgi:peptidyl-tRNA hydrolase